jgi:hypothetical protein
MVLFRSRLEERMKTKALADFVNGSCRCLGKSALPKILKQYEPVKVVPRLQADFQTYILVRHFSTLTLRIFLSCR